MHAYQRQYFMLRRPGSGRNGVKKKEKKKKERKEKKEEKKIKWKRSKHRSPGWVEGGGGGGKEE